MYEVIIKVMFCSELNKNERMILGEIDFITSGVLPFLHEEKAQRTYLNFPAILSVFSIHRSLVIPWERKTKNVMCIRDGVLEQKKKRDCLRECV